jgi:hypothetical protein
MTNLKLPRIRDDIRQLLRSGAEERVREQTDGKANEEVVREVTEEVAQEKQEIEEEIEEDLDMPLGDIIGDGEMQPFESSDVTMAEIQRSLSNLEGAQETLAEKATLYEKQYQELVENADPDSFTEEQIIATRLHKKRVFFETMLQLLDDVGEMLEETVKMLETAVSDNMEAQLGIGEVLGEEDREGIAEEINEKEHEQSIGISSRDRLETGAEGGVSQDKKALRESSGGINPVDTEMGQTARKILGSDDEDEDEDEDKGGDIGPDF